MTVRAAVFVALVALAACGIAAGPDPYPPGGPAIGRGARSRAIPFHPRATPFPLRVVSR